MNPFKAIDEWKAEVPDGRVRFGQWYLDKYMPGEKWPRLADMDGPDAAAGMIAMSMYGLGPVRANLDDWWSAE